MTHPNILFIMTDQQRWDAMSCAGDWVRTPNLDRIAAEGVRFTYCVTTTPICIPARVTLATGHYPHNNNVWDNITYAMPEGVKTWMGAIRDLGYRTSMFGKTHLHPHRGDLREREHLINAYGLDDVDEIGGPRASAAVMSHMTKMWEDKGLLESYREDFKERFANKPHVARPSVLPLEDYADVYVGQRTKEYLEGYNRDEPWFCWMSFGGPHEPWDAPEPYASMYDPEAMPAPVPRPDEPPRPKGVLDLMLERLSPRFDPGDEGAMRANYAGNVTLIDDQIGEVLSVIEARGEMDNTVIGFTSDHGEMNGDWGLIYKMNFLDGALRVPLLVRTPETAANGGGKIVDAPAENCDLGPTLLELAGGSIDYPQFAKSLVPAMENGSTHRDAAISEYRGEFMVTDGKWKAAVNKDGKVYLLFDLVNDPRETRNLAGLSEYAHQSDAMRLRLFERVSETQFQSGVEWRPPV
ncbi:MAG: sulfatase-like hydrolase/transferase [Gammaproteobacteria bacterium]|nr:sulfatase-like hydrolase/transferase [Gammaproteobacteria bacterium]